MSELQTTTVITDIANLAEGSSFATGVSLTKTFLDSLYNKQFSLHYYTTSGSDVSKTTSISGTDTVKRFGSIVDKGSGVWEFVPTTLLLRKLETDFANQDSLTFTIDAAIPAKAGSTVFPNNNVSVEAITDEFKKRDLQDEYLSELLKTGVITELTDSGIAGLDNSVKRADIVDNVLELTKGDNTQVSVVLPSDTTNPIVSVVLVGSTLTFTKKDGSTHAIPLPTGGGSGDSGDSAPTPSGGNEFTSTLIAESVRFWSDGYSIGTSDPIQVELADTGTC